jgi:hypothetical protein
MRLRESEMRDPSSCADKRGMKSALARAGGLRSRPQAEGLPYPATKR